MEKCLEELSQALTKQLSNNLDNKLTVDLANGMSLVFRDNARQILQRHMGEKDESRSEKEE